MEPPKASKRTKTSATNRGSTGIEGSWTFLSNHAHVLVCLARDPSARLRDIADQVGITERGVFRVITELERGGAISRTREGRRNHYTIHTSVPLRHHLESNRTVGSLLELLLEPAEAKRLARASSKRSPDLSRERRSNAATRRPPSRVAKGHRRRSTASL